MKKLYVLLLAVLGTSASYGQAFTALYDFSGVTTTSGLTDPTPVPNVTGLTFGSFTAANSDATLNSSGAGRFSIANQPLGGVNGSDTYTDLTGAIDLNTYFSVTITPNANYSFDLSQLSFRTQRSGTGIRTYAVRSSIDGYSSNLPATVVPDNAEIAVQPGNIFFRTHDLTTTGQNGSTVTFNNFTNITSPVTLRFYGWNAEAAGGTFSIDDVTITGVVNSLGVNHNDIAGLAIYPNPVSGGNVYITSASNQSKSVVIYDILGKTVVNTTTDSAVNVSNLKGGVYVMKITEAGKTATRKLVIK
ncbi:MAG: T9SS type A sorting domain-containing protein [Flavobacterium sp.]|nr:MAG: T9SS type A sorting domain-containing protein [Flavobacterium sp.]